MKRITLTALLLGSAGLWSAPASALNLLGSCEVSATATAGFGVYDTLSGSNNDSASGSVRFTCYSLLNALGGTITFTIKLNNGLWGVFPQRAMSSGGNKLNYNLYMSSARTTIWGDGTSGTGVKGGTFHYPALIGVGVKREEIHHFYGRIPANQNVAAGEYGDTVTVTVIY
ncbi:MAG: spore coat U domain-containing protein [Pseudomonas sp.]|nr:spore coat U domain-containing protein [Pseudomonas sp.]